MFHARNVIMPGEKYKDGQVNKTDQTCWGNHIPRDSPELVKVVRSLGKLANGAHADLRVVEIPDDVNWEIQDCDGIERVREKSRSWG